MGARAACPDARLLEDLIAGALPADAEARLNEHLTGCPHCREELDRLLASPWDQAARGLADGPTQLDPHLKEAVAQLLHRPSTMDAATLQTSPDSSAFATDEPPLPGHIGPYRILERVGQGGFGIVYRARDEKLDRIVALKVLTPARAEDAACRKRFLREAQSAAAIRDDHVVGIHAVDENDGQPYLVMEFIHGVSLQRRLERTGPLEVNEILRIGAQTAAGLAAAHRQGLVHRDINPSNILLENGVERVKITDFGLARAVDDASLSHQGTVMGTPEYMAPEQARGEAVDHRADLFSLGCVLYALCTGRAPFAGSSTPAVLKRVCDDPPPPIRSVNPDIPHWLVKVVDKLMAKAPEARFQSASDVADVLSRRLAECSQAGLPRSAQPSGRLSRRVLPVLAAAAVVAVGVFAWSPWNGLGPKSKKDAAAPVKKGPGQAIAAPPKQWPPRVLFILASKDFYFPEYWSIRARFERDGVKVTVAAGALEAAEPVPNVMDPKQMPVDPDVALADVFAADYEAIYFCGGTGVEEFVGNGQYAAQARRLIDEALAAERLVTALGTGPVVLAEAGVLKGVRATCYPFGQPPGIYRRRLERAGAIVVDVPAETAGLFVTGRGPSDMNAFAEAVLKRLNVP
jgi:serine/threonine-protein kinase